MFSDYKESGARLLTGEDGKLVGQFVLSNATSTIANTLRRCIITDVRTVGFTNIVIHKNTSKFSNEFLSHRLTLIPPAIRNIDTFDTSRYKCTLSVKNNTKGDVREETIYHVTTKDIKVHEKQQGADDEWRMLEQDVTNAMFPSDSLTKDHMLFASLRPHWNPDQPPEEIELSADLIIGSNKEPGDVGFQPVSQCTFENMLDDDTDRQNEYFTSWVLDYKKLTVATLPPEKVSKLKKEWETLAIQRCFKVNAKGEPYIFNFTIESVGVRPVKDIVLEGIQSVITLVRPFADIMNESVSLQSLGMTVQPSDKRMNGVDVLFVDQGHTLGNLLQTVITELFLDQTSFSPIVTVSYMVPHPLQKIMKMCLGFQDTTTNTEQIMRNVIGTASKHIVNLFETMAQSWIVLTGVGSSTPPPASSARPQQPPATSRGVPKGVGSSTRPPATSRGVPKSETAGGVGAF